MLFLQLIVVASVTGYVVQKLAKWLDMAMDYGKILHSVRYSIVLNSVKDKDQFKQDYVKAVGCDIDERVNLVDRVLRSHSSVSASYILCPVCFGTRLLIPVSVVNFWLFVGDWTYLPIFILFTLIGFVE